MEPYTIVAGTSLSWSRDDAYAHGLWAYQYIFTGPQQITLNASGDAGVVMAEVVVADTANWSAGKYQWTLQRKKDLEAVVVATGFITVLENPVGQVTVDHRTHAEKMLSLIETRLEGRMVSDHESYTVNGKSLNRIPIEQLSALAQKYRNLVAKEKRREAGKQPARRGLFRMR
ncbi:MAG: hypothetical protein RPT11_02935 [Bermanella sp.]